MDDVLGLTEHIRDPQCLPQCGQVCSPGQGDKVGLASPMENMTFFFLSLQLTSDLEG